MAWLMAAAYDLGQSTALGRSSGARYQEMPDDNIYLHKNTTIPVSRGIYWWM